MLCSTGIPLCSHLYPIIVMRTLEETEVMGNAATCRSREEDGVDGEGVLMPQVPCRPSSICSGGAGFCEQEE